MKYRIVVLTLTVVLLASFLGTLDGNIFAAAAQSDTSSAGSGRSNLIVTLLASAVCNGPDLDVTITSGDGPFDITASQGINTPVTGVSVGTTTISGPEKWDNVTVTETAGDAESINLGQFKCRTDERPVPLSPAHRSRTTETNPTFTWTGISGTSNYRIFIFDDKVVASRTVDIRENSGGPTQLTVSTPLPVGRLFWRVRGRQNRIWSLWSVRFTLFVDPPPEQTPEVTDQ